MEKFALRIVPDIFISDGMREYKLSKGTKSIKEEFKDGKWYITITTTSKMFDFEENWTRYNSRPMRVNWIVRAYKDAKDYSRACMYHNWKLIETKSEVCNDSGPINNVLVFEAEYRTK